MNTCEYECVNGFIENGGSQYPIAKLKLCGKPGINIVLPNNKQVKRFLGTRKQICLCDEHREFVMDAIQPVEVIKKEKGLNLI